MNDRPNQLHRELDAEKTESAIIRVERAAAELRYGRPVRVTDGRGTSLAVLALDAIGAGAYGAFAKATDHRHTLFLTSHRAGVLGLDAPHGALVPLGSRDLAEAAMLGYLRGAETPEEFGPGTQLSAEAGALARLALLLPIVVCAEIETGDGFADALEIQVGDCARAADAGFRRFEIVADTEVPLKDVEAARFVVFRGGLAQRDQVAIVVGTPDLSKPVPVRVHSSCITGDLFGSLKCDCGDQLRNGLTLLEKRGGGVLLYLDQEGRGTGIGAKMRAYGMQAEGMDTIDADAVLGFGADERRYETAAAMLQGLGIASVDLLTNNPMKIQYLKACGIDVAARTPVLGTVTSQNEGYLRTKARRVGHMMDIDRLMAGSN